MRGIPQQSRAFRASQCRPFEPGAPGGRIVIQPVDKIRPNPFGPCLELVHPSGWSLPVPWADLLADGAAEHPPIELFGLIIREHPAMLDRPVADASACIELIRARE